MAPVHQFAAILCLGLALSLVCWIWFAESGSAWSNLALLSLFSSGLAQLCHPSPGIQACLICGWTACPLGRHDCISSALSAPSFASGRFCASAFVGIWLLCRSSICWRPEGFLQQHSWRMHRQSIIPGIRIVIIRLEIGCLVFLGPGACNSPQMLR